MKLYEVDPAGDRRWLDLVQRYCWSSVFHTPEWLATLKRTYGYEPVVFTDSAPGEQLQNGLVFCRISSWLTGRRLVSLPFSDHCDPLIATPEAFVAMLNSLKAKIGHEGNYIEVRPLSPRCMVDGFEESATYCCHSIDLRPELSAIFGRFHKSHTQRSIRKAERSGLTLDTGTPSDVLKDFYWLHSLTRRRQNTPVQPYDWFKHLVEQFGNRLSIYLARHEGAPAAAILTIVHKKTLVYKYGCSDTAFNRFGTTPLLFWRAIQDAKTLGLEQFDLGRSDLDNDGLIAFKQHLGGERTPLSYYRYGRHSLKIENDHRKLDFAKRVYALFPEGIQSHISERLYKHFG